MDRIILCRPKSLPGTHHSTRPGPGLKPIAVDKKKFWGKKVDLTVSFLDGADATLKKMILQHLNAWSKTANVRFRETAGQGQVRISRITATEDPDMSGYWSYVGTDIRKIPVGQPTMNLEAFTKNTPLSEFRRVVRHEAGHTLGCEHEHMRRDIVERIDRDKAIKYFFQTDGWSADDVEAQVLTPIEEKTLIGTPKADMTSIMCYDLPASIMKDNKPVVGGKDINSTDSAFIGKLYPKTAAAKKKSAAKKPSAKKKSSAKKSRK